MTSDQAEATTRRTYREAGVGLATRRLFCYLVGGDVGRQTVERHAAQRSGWRRSARSTAIAADARAGRRANVSCTPSDAVGSASAMTCGAAMRRRRMRQTLVAVQP